MKIKFTEFFFENEWNGLLEYFPELKNSKDHVFEVLEIKKVQVDEDEDEKSIGITKIKSDVDGAVYDINEISKLAEEIRPINSWWCFVFDDFPKEFEIVEGGFNAN